MGAPKMKPPPIPPPPAIPQESPDTADQAIEKQRRKSGFEKTIVAGGLTPNTGKKITLG